MARVRRLNTLHVRESQADACLHLHDGRRSEVHEHRKRQTLLFTHNIHRTESCDRHSLHVPFLCTPWASHPDTYVRIVTSPDRACAGNHDSNSNPTALPAGDDVVGDLLGQGVHGRLRVPCLCQRRYVGQRRSLSWPCDGIVSPTHREAGTGTRRRPRPSGPGRRTLLPARPRPPCCHSLSPFCLRQQSATGPSSSTPTFDGERRHSQVAAAW